jgi:uroporphyrinogen-III synthase
MEFRVSASPFYGQTVVITRAPEQSNELARLLSSAGARVVEVPALTIVPVGGEEAAALDASVHEVFRGGYDGVLFTSSNTVTFFDERVRALGFDPRALSRTPSGAPSGASSDASSSASSGPPSDASSSASSSASSDALSRAPLHARSDAPVRTFNHTTLYAIGPATAGSLVERGYPAPRVADEAIAEGLLALVRSELGSRLPGSRWLLPRAREGRNVIVEGLRAAGAQIEVVVAYETRPVTNGPGLPQGVCIDWITFASPSAVRAFHQRFGTIETRVACIGPVTAEAARKAGFDVAAVGREHTAAGMVQAMLDLSR